MNIFNRLINNNTFLRGMYAWYKMYIKVQNKYKYGEYGKGAVILSPIDIVNFSNVFIGKYSRIQAHSKIINYSGKFIIKDYSACGAGLTVVTGNHKPIVGIPQAIANNLHIGDLEKNVCIDEDVWIGSNVTLLSGAYINRGCFVGSGSLVNREIPPYAIVVGIPAKIIKCRFSIEQIIEHEKALYPESMRYKYEELQQIFSNYYSDKVSMDPGVINNSDYEKILNFYQKEDELNVLKYAVWKYKNCK